MYCYVIIVMYAAIVLYAVIDTYIHAVIDIYVMTDIHAFVITSAVTVIYAVLSAICDRLSADQKHVHLLNLILFLKRGGSCDEACVQC